MPKTENVRSARVFRFRVESEKTQTSMLFITLGASASYGHKLKSNLQLRPQILRSVLRLRSTSTNSGADGKAVVQAKDDSSNKIEISLAPPKGTRDFYPEDHRLKSWLFGMWRDIARQYGFEEYDAPVVEHVELYIRKAGEEVTQQ
eukprot:gene32097-38816_t